MKKGIFVALAALALAVFAVPEAQGSNGRTLNVSLAGSNYASSDENGMPTPLDGQPLVAVQNGIVKGGGGALWTSNAELEQVPANPLEFPPDCLAQGLAGAPLTLSFVLMYNDGSLLSLSAGPDSSFFCTDGTNFTVDVAGIVTGGNGRFEGATGNFTGTAFSEPPRVTAELTINLN
ncbi:MAG: hypothetical protein JRG93_20555 [Deltaproteobacteria bacterium]|nr:hypothetical protein [Deltaproteobacteria bacterium]MBW2381502.1 hypothetical protein [Deltaproteobacteria bacterium]